MNISARRAAIILPAAAAIAIVGVAGPAFAASASAQAPTANRNGVTVVKLAGSKGLYAKIVGGNMGRSGYTLKTGKLKINPGATGFVVKGYPAKGSQGESFKLSLKNEGSKVVSGYGIFNGVRYEFVPTKNGRLEYDSNPTIGQAVSSTGKLHFRDGADHLALAVGFAGRVVK